MTPLQVYQRLEELALPLIEAYQSDLTKIDKGVILGNGAGTPFLCFVRACGTHTLFLTDPTDSDWPREGETVKYLFGFSDRYKILEGAVEAYTNVAKQPETLLAVYFDGKDVKEVSIEFSLGVLAQWRSGIAQHWERIQTG